MNKFFNFDKRAFVTDGTEEKHGRHYIKMGFCGFNSPANNRLGYATRAKAEAALLRYQSHANESIAFYQNIGK